MGKKVSKMAESTPKISSNEATLSSNFIIQQLPEEMLIEIFSHLNLRGLRVLALTCKQFYKIIQQKPVQILRKFPHRLEKITDFDGLLKLQKPENLEIYETFGLYKFINVRQQFEIYIKVLKIKCFKVEISNLRKLLMSCKNLKVLSLDIQIVENDEFEESESSDSFDSDESDEIHDFFQFRKTKPKILIFRKKEFESPKLNLDKISISSNLKILLIFDQCQAKHVCVFMAQNLRFIENYLESFLLRQKDLENLEFHKCESLNFLALKDCEFQLKKITFMDCEKIFFRNIRDFIYKQKQSLTYVKTNIAEGFLMENLLRLDNLKTVEFCFKDSSQNYFSGRSLTVTFCEIERKSINDSAYLFQVENLKVIGSMPRNYEENQNLASVFLNIKNLSICGGKTKVHLKNYTKLESLKINRTIFPTTFEIPKSVKKLTLFVTFFPSCPIFNYNGNKIKELTIKGAANLDWLFGFLINLSTNLKLLKIINSNVDFKTKIILKIFAYKIEKLEIIGNEFMTYIDGYFYYQNPTQTIQFLSHYVNVKTINGTLEY